MQIQFDEITQNGLGIRNTDSRFGLAIAKRTAAATPITG
jgi:hypothetical protein